MDAELRLLKEQEYIAEDMAYKREVEEQIWGKKYVAYIMRNCPN
jgi:hypothetical protein